MGSLTTKEYMELYYKLGNHTKVANYLGKDPANLRKWRRKNGLLVHEEPTPGGVFDLSYLEKRGKIKLGSVSDTHINSKFQQLTHLNTLYDIFAHEEIEVVLHSGDLGCGFGVYRGQAAEIFNHTAEDQTEYIISKYPAIDTIYTYGIAGNHDWAMVKAGAQNPLQILSDRRTDYNYLGVYEANIKISKKASIMLFHPGGGYSRKLIANQIKGQENKPSIMISGHWHNYEVFIENGVFVVMPGCFEGLTHYMRRKSLFPAIGGVILDIELGKGGAVKYFRPRFVGFKEKLKDY